MTKELAFGYPLIIHLLSHYYPIIIHLLSIYPNEPGVHYIPGFQSGTPSHRSPPVPPCPEWAAAIPRMSWEIGTLQSEP